MSNLKSKRTALEQLEAAKAKGGDTWARWGIRRHGEYIVIRNSSGGTEIIFPNRRIYHANRTGWAKVGN